MNEFLTVGFCESYYSEATKEGEDDIFTGVCQ
jgi:hypothetical protein